MQPAVHEGRLNAESFSFAIVASRWNEFISNRLVEGALDGLERLGAQQERVEVFRVPGAFEIPLLALRLAESEKFDAVICLGAVIRGDTPHFEYICAEVSRGIGQAALETGVPIVFGVLTTETVAQAIERADPAKFNRGGEAAKVAIEMATVLRRIHMKGPQAHRTESALSSKRIARRPGT